MLAPFDPAIRALRPTWEHPEDELRQDVKRVGWAVLDESKNAAKEGVWRKVEGALDVHGGVADAPASPASKDLLDELPPWKVCVAFYSAM